LGRRTSPRCIALVISSIETKLCTNQKADLVLWRWSPSLFSPVRQRAQDFGLRSGQIVNDQLTLLGSGFGSTPESISTSTVGQPNTIGIGGD